MAERITIDVSVLYSDGGRETTAKFKHLGNYTDQALEAAGNGNDIILTGPGPVWLYLYIAHALHGKARSLTYDSPVTGQVTIFNHSPE